MSKVLYAACCVAGAIGVLMVAFSIDLSRARLGGIGTVLVSVSSYTLGALIAVGTRRWTVDKKE